MKRFIFCLILLLPMVSFGQDRTMTPQFVVGDPVVGINARITQFIKKAVIGDFVRSYDGDAVRIRYLRNNRLVEKSYRLIAIDAPERATRQPYWEESQRSITDMLAGKMVTLDVRGFDTVYRRSLVKVLVDGVDVGLEQVRRGAAWYLPLYGKSLTEEEKAQYAAAQAEAKALKRGLWGLPKPIEPRIWRKYHRK